MPHNRVVQTPIFRKKNFLKNKIFKNQEKRCCLLRVRACMYAYMCIFIYKVYYIYSVIFIFIKDFLLIC